jgi:type IV secretory pathway protease TraF
MARKIVFDRLEQSRYGRWTRNRRRARKDHSGRPLPSWQGCRVICRSEIFLTNPNEPASLDGCYFGPLPIASMAGLAERCGRPHRTDHMA